jgi:hypothetical protein
LIRNGSNSTTASRALMTRFNKARPDDDNRLDIGLDIVSKSFQAYDETLVQVLCIDQLFDSF